MRLLRLPRELLLLLLLLLLLPIDAVENAKDTIQVVARDHRHEVRRWGGCGRRRWDRCRPGRARWYSHLWLGRNSKRVAAATTIAATASIRSSSTSATARTSQRMRWGCHGPG